jgi:hypothetical protein
MVDNPENILVEFDYNNITIIDPNKVIDENGRAKERLVKQEDLVMYANLECKVLPRTKLAVGTANNDAIQTVSIATINFLKPGDKTFLDNSWTDEITGKGSVKGEGVNQPKLNSIKNPNRSDDFYIRQTNNSGGNPGSTDNGLLGITSINIRQNTSFMPMVTIKLVDVKGKALFESGDNSPYAAFFNLPYPMFQLTIKGFYGKAVRLPLMLQNFTSSFNYSTSNFDITLTFYTYKYTLLSEVTMGSLMATPHMYKNNLSIEPKKGTSSQYVKVKDTIIEKGYQKVKEVYSEYKTKGLIPDEFPELTLVQMKNNIENFLKNIFDSFSKQNMESLNDVVSYQKTLNEYQKDVYTAINGSWFKKYMDGENFFILDKNKTKIYTFKAELDAVKKQNAINELVGTIINPYNKKLNGNKTVGKNGKYSINGKGESTPIDSNIDYEKDFFVEITNFEKEIDLKESYLQRKKTKTEPDETQLNLFKSELSKTNIFNAAEVKLEDGDIKVKYSWFKFEDGTNGLNIGGKVTDFASKATAPTGSFMDKTNQMGKNLKTYREKIEVALTEALSNLLQNKDNGIGFVPNIRNVLAVIFANGEAFLRLMDDVHSSAWEQRDDVDRKKAIFNSQVAGASADNLTSGVNETIPVYPWPQLVVETAGNNGQEKYEIKYPGDITLQSAIKSYLPDKWPEVEFVEEFVKGITQRLSPPSNPTPSSNELLDVNRVSLNAFEFPVGNYVFSNKEEIKYFFEIYERLLLISTTSKLSRVLNSTSYTDKIVDLIADSESQNMIKSLSSADPYIIKKLTEYALNSNNFLATLRHFSNGGLGQSWQNYIRGIYNTPYIKNLINNGGFEFMNEGVLNSSATQPLISLINEPDMVEYITGSSTSNEYDFTDTYPFTNKDWDKTYLADSASASNPNQYFNTGKVLTFNEGKKVITNFSNTSSSDEKRPITNFNFKKVSYPTDYSTSITDFTLKSFYENRLFENQLPTEGNVNYYNYNNQLTANQTTSIFNTPYFINSIQEGVQNFRDYSKYPFVSAAYYFINSLPLATLREKYKTYNQTSTTDLDYIFATLKKYGAIHKLPYAWILKMGSVWHRYKTYVETNVDILDKSWSGFSYTNNYDPDTNNNEKTYSLTINGEPIDIVLQQTAFIGVEESTLINTGFYPKVINDFNVFYQGFQVYSGYTSGAIQDGFNSGITMNYVSNAIINYPEGFDPGNLNRDLRIIPWSVTMTTLDGQFQYVMPSQGSLINQTKSECFDINSAPINQLKVEVVSNDAMYNGSVRLFWASPNYGYYDNDLVSKPSPTEYMKKVLSGSSVQQNFSINNIGEYTKMSEIFSVFEKDVLDKFETIFLNFSKSIYDIDGGNMTEDPLLVATFGDSEESDSYKNFQSLLRDMMKVVKEKSTNGQDFVTKVQNAQLINISQKINGFLNVNVVFKYANPSNFNRRLFQTFSNLEIIDPYTWENYTVSTPDALPTSGNSVTLSQSVSLYPNEWKTLRTHVGFSDVTNLSYSSNGSYITDFFVDLNIAFNSTNIKNFSPIIKIYATQKLNEGNMNSDKFSQLMTTYLNLNQNFQDKIINNLMIKLQNNLPKTTITSEGTVGTEDNLEQTKGELYQMFKALNDKWISGNDFKTKTLFEDVLLMDRASRDIGDKILVDIFKLKNRLTNINAATSMLTYVQSILVENHFVVMNLPSYINFYNVQDAVKNPTPKAEGSMEFANTMFGTFLNVDYRDSSAKMVCFYGGKPSEQLDLKNNIDYRYRSDAFDLRRASDNPLVEDQIGKTDWDKSNKVVGFNVDIGPQNQQIFVGFDVQQSAGQATAESLEILNQMANQEGNRGGSTQNTSLYNLYKNRSYTCQVTMMGNALIQPTMYFNLRYVPMFSGPYMILEVNHTISPGSFLTYVKGIRQPTASLPKIDNYLQSLRTNLLQSLIDKNEEDKKAKDGTTTTNANTVIGQKNDVNKNLTTHPANTSSANIDDKCKPASSYSKYVGETPKKTETSTITMRNTIISKTDNIVLQNTIFSAMYLASYIGSKFKTNQNNFAGIRLDENWGGVSTYFYGNKYYCSSDNTPYAYFENLEKSVEFLVARWGLRMGNVTLDEKSITKFLMLNPGANTLNENIYTTYDKTNLSTLESKVKKAINLFISSSA